MKRRRRERKKERQTGKELSGASLIRPVHVLWESQDKREGKGRSLC